MDEEFQSIPMSTLFQVRDSEGRPISDSMNVRADIYTPLIIVSQEGTKGIAGLIKLFLDATNYWNAHALDDEPLKGFIEQEYFKLHPPVVVVPPPPPVIRWTVKPQITIWRIRSTPDSTLASNIVASLKGGDSIVELERKQVGTFLWIRHDGGPTKIMGWSRGDGLELSS